MGCGATKSQQQEISETREVSKKIFIDAQKAKEQIQQFKTVKLLDIRKQESHEKDRIPDSILASFPEQFRKTYEEKGIEYLEKYLQAYFKQALKLKQSDQLILYDESLDSNHGPHICYFFLKYLGYHNVAILDGGLEAWKQQNFETIEGKIESQEEEINMENQKEETDNIQKRQNWIVNETQVQDNIDSKQKTIIDVREATEYQKGTIPGSINLPLSELFYKNENGKFLKKEAQIRQVLSDLKLKPGDNLVVYCMRGYRGSQVLCTLKEMGYSNVELYLGSFLEWKNNQNRIEIQQQ